MNVNEGTNYWESHLPFGGRAGSQERRRPRRRTLLDGASHRAEDDRRQPRVGGSSMAETAKRATRLFFAADIHGSQVTFRKFLAAAAFYGVDALVFGGDLMGKALVPIVPDERRVSTRPSRDATRIRGRRSRRRSPAPSSSPASTGRSSSATSTRPSKPTRWPGTGCSTSSRSERLAEWIELRRGSAARERASGSTDRRERRRAGGAGDARPARRGARRRERGPPRRAGRRAHDDHGRALDAHAVGHASGGERGGDRAGAIDAAAGGGARPRPLRVQPALPAEGHARSTRA